MSECKKKNTRDIFLDLTKKNEFFLSDSECLKGTQHASQVKCPRKRDQIRLKMSSFHLPKDPPLPKNK